MSSSASGVGLAMGNPAQVGHEPPEGKQQTSPRRASALQLALPPAEATEETASLPAENDLDDEALFQKLKDRKAGVMKKPAAAASGKGNLPKAKSAAAESKTAGQGPAKKKGKGKGKGKLSKDKSASHKGQGKEEKQQAEGSQGKNPKRKFSLVWEYGCIQKNYASRMYAEQHVVECQREAHREAILLWKKKNGC
eukprot:s4214_g5.t1